MRISRRGRKKHPQLPAPSSRVIAEANAVWTRLVAHAERRGESFAIALVRVDQVIHEGRASTLDERVLAAHLKQTVRAEDQVLTLVGGECLVFLAAALADEGGAVSFRMQNAVAGKPLTTSDGTTLYVTLDCGIAEWRPELTTLAELLAYAVYGKRRFPSSHRRSES